MNATEDDITFGGGETPPCAGPVSSALPEVQTLNEKVNLQTGVSTLNAHTETQQKDSESCWYAIRCAYGKELKAYNFFISKDIKAFYPTLKKQKYLNGKKSFAEESRLPNIFFAYGTFDQLKEYVYDNVHEETKHIRFYYNRHHDGTKEPLVIPEKQMRSLMLICNSEIDDILLKPFAVEKFKKGQHVIIKEGPFAGIEGVVARFQGQQRVGIVIKGLLTAVTAYIPNGFLERL